MIDRDPPRLASSRAASPLGRALVASGRIPAPSASAREALWGAIAGEIATAGLATHATGTPETAALGKLAAVPVVPKALVAAAMASMVVVGMVAKAAWHPGGDSVRAPSAVAPLPTVVVAVDAPWQPASAEATDDAVQVTPPVARVPPHASSPSAARGAPRAAPRAAAAPPSESALLLEARRAARAGDCVTALANAEEAGRAFPQGMLAEERETLAIQGLECLGRTGDAAERRVAFELRFPGSVFRGSGVAPR